MLLEQTSANVSVKVVGEEIPNIQNTCLQCTTLRGVLQRLLEDRLVPLQRVLVHRVNQRQLCNAEEEETGVEGEVSIVLSCLVDASLCLYRDLHLLVDLLRSLLRLLKFNNKCLVH